MVVSGAPEKDMNHAERICDMAMDMIDASVGIKDPSGSKWNRLPLALLSDFSLYFQPRLSCVHLVLPRPLTVKVACEYIWVPNES